jgi:hypothetical protein
VGPARRRQHGKETRMGNEDAAAGRMEQAIGRGLVESPRTSLQTTRRET